jgi:hypothetical protein
VADAKPRWQEAQNSTETREDSGKQPKTLKNCHKLTDSSYFQLEIGLVVLA